MISVVGDLIKKGILRYREEHINLLDTEFKVLNDLAEYIKSANRRLFFEIPESNALLLRLLFTELAYLSVNESTIYFATDNIGKRFLINTLKDLNTGKTDLYFLLVKRKKNKIQFIDSNKADSILDKSSIIVHFRSYKKADRLSAHKKEIIIFTDKDRRRLGNSYGEIISELEKHSWKKLFFDVPTKQKIREGTAKISLVEDDFLNQLVNYLQSIEMKDSLVDAIEEFICFYMLLPIPLKYMNSYCYDFDEIKGRLELPSETILKLEGIDNEIKIITKTIFAEIERYLFEENPKFSNFFGIIKFHCQNKEQVSVLLPNKMFADAFSWTVENMGLTLGILDENIWYPELMSREAFIDENKVDCILIPFIPLRETLIDANKLASKLVLVLYESELHMLEQMVGKDLKSSVLENSHHYNSKIDAKSIILKKHDSEMYLSYQKRTGKYWGNSDAYNQFLHYLEKDDSLEDSKMSEPLVLVDSNNYVFVSENLNQFNLSVWESVILVKKGFYSWIFPSRVEIGHTIIIIPRELRLLYLKKELSSNFLNNSEINRDIGDLVNYIAEWKQALITVSKNYSLPEICETLEKNGLLRTYAAIRNWFEGIDSDPRESAIASIVTTKYNIGPRNSEDIKIFGETFGVKNLISNHKYIEASMKYFRTNHIRAGRKAMHNIIKDIKTGKKEGTLYTIKVKKIIIKN